MTTPPIPCSADNGRGAAALGDCPTQTTTLFDASSLGKPLAVAAASPPVWATTLSARGSYVGLDDGTVRLVGDGAPRIVAGQAGEHCATPTEPCGDGGPATEAQLATPAGLAVGLDGSLYIADPGMHKVRKIDSSKRISTVAGNGQECAASGDACGDGGLATAAALSGPTGVWVDPLGELWIADGRRGLRHVLPNGAITSLDLGAGPYDIQSVVGDSSGHLYATTVGPDYLLQVDPASGQASQVVGTGTSGYNGTTDPNLGNLLPGQSGADRPSHGTGRTARRRRALRRQRQQPGPRLRAGPGPRHRPGRSGRERHHAPGRLQRRWSVRRQHRAESAPGRDDDQRWTIPVLGCRYGQ